MDWIKIPIDEVLLSDRKDWQNYALIKYMALYCQLEREPSDNQLHRILNKKEFDFVKNEYNVVLKLIQDHIKVVQNKRHINKIQYNKKISKNNTVSNIQKSDRLLSDRAEKIREDKIRLEEKEINKEKDKKYAFEGKVIKLNQKDYDSWKEQFNLLDLDYELKRRDIWLASEPETTQKKWFMSTQLRLLTLQKEEKEKKEYIPQDWSWLND